MQLQQANLLKNLDDDWLKSSKNRYSLVKSSYENSNSCTKFIVPRRVTPNSNSNLLYNVETVPYAISTGNDRKLRYWDFSNLK